MKKKAQEEKPRFFSDSLMESSEPKVLQDQLGFKTGPIDLRELDLAIRNAK